MSSYKNPEHYLTDAQGKRTHVILDVTTYKSMLKHLKEAEELEDSLLLALAQLRVATEKGRIPFEKVKNELDARHGISSTPDAKD